MLFSWRHDPLVPWHLTPPKVLAGSSPTEPLRRCWLGICMNPTLDAAGSAREWFAGSWQATTMYYVLASI